MKKIIIAENYAHLKSLIKIEIEINGINCDLNHIDVSNITDMFGLFNRSKFNGDISQWDVSKVTDMEGMFKRSHFNGDISKWNVSSVENMNEMFYCSWFKQDLSQWDISNVKNLDWAFVSCDCIPWWNIKNYEERQLKIESIKIKKNKKILENEPLLKSSYSKKIIL